MHRSGQSSETSRLVRLRRLCWAAVLSYEPLVAEICQLAVEDRRRTNGATRSLCEMYRQLRDGTGDPEAPRFDHEAATARLIAAIAEADVDDLWLDRVLADMVSLQAGIHDGLSLPACSACVRDPAFVAYLTSVRAAYFVLGIERRRVEAMTPVPGLPRG
nr:hypothetical protein [Nannocystis sp.]